MKFLKNMLAALLVSLPGVAAACPACALREEGGIYYQLLMAAMILLPFAVASVVVLAVRRASQEDGPSIPSQGAARAVNAGAGDNNS